ncbi:MAG: hypothetical protein EBZ77_14180, partial [Chitinophagia bacterium]|nr:hypothetical protein [Chitinophagia bacterium]
MNIGGQQLCAQQWPTENAVLHYRLVGFIAPPDNNTGELQIASGMCAEESCFAQSTIIKTPLKGGRAIVELPSFGLPYTWRIVKRVNGELQRGELMHFFVAASPGVDTSKLRMRITAHTPAANNWYVFSDELKALFDSKGRAVWFLPALPSVIDPMAMIRDLKMTPQGTITFINNDNIFEIDWNGKPLWKGPNNSNTGSSDIGVYHHEFTRLANGHYMVLTNETLCTDGKQLYKLKSPNAAQNEYNIKAGFTLRDAKGNGDGCNMYCNIAEYNQQGQLVWLWRSFPKLQHMFSADNTRIFNADTHANSFWFDAAAHMVYLSFRDCNQILKIKYPSGEIVASYGGSCTGGKTPSDTLFCGQHAVSTLRDGSLLVFNNNICHNGQKPYLLLCNQLAGNQLKPRLKI